MTRARLRCQQFDHGRAVDDDQRPDRPSSIARMSVVLMSAVACLRACSAASATVGLAASRSIELRR